MEEDDHTIIAHENFIFISTMNPGGDYGKKELSPALRNRFTEIWCENCIEKNDLRAIIEHNLLDTLLPEKTNISMAITNFIEWMSTLEIGIKFMNSIRDVLTWVDSINKYVLKTNSSKMNVGSAYCNGAYLIYLDGLGSGLTSTERWVIFVIQFRINIFNNKTCDFISAWINYNFSDLLLLNTLTYK